MKLLVTGGCGFIGSNFVRYVLDRAPESAVINYDKLTYAGNPANLADIRERYGESRYAFIHADIADPAAVREALAAHKPDAVINFAAESHVDRSIHDPSPFVTTNILGTQILIQAAKEAGIPRFIQISTDEVYGSLGPEGLFTENTPLDPRSPYSASKAGADLLVQAFVHTFDYPAIITRCSNNYGPYQFPEKLIPLMFSQAMADEPLPVYGDGLNIRDWIHVRDHCRGIWLALTKGKSGRTYNFGGAAERTNLQVVDAILRTLGKPPDLIRFVKDRPGHDRRYAIDFSLAATELGFAPSCTFEDGLKETLDWYKDNTQWLEQIKSGAYLKFMDAWYKERLNQAHEGQS